MKQKTVESVAETIGQRIAEKSPCRCKVACILIDRNGKVVATGFNHRADSCRLGNPTSHAEAVALNKVRKPSTNLTCILYRDKMKPIHPCPSCQELLYAYGIAEVWHTTGEDLNRLKDMDYDYEEMRIKEE